MLAQPPLTLNPTGRRRRWLASRAAKRQRGDSVRRPWTALALDWSKANVNARGIALGGPRVARTSAPRIDTS